MKPRLFPIPAVLVLVCSLAVAAGTPDFSEQLAAIEKAQQQASARYHEELAKAHGSSDEAVRRFLDEVEKNTEAALALVRSDPTDPNAVRALRFVITTARGGPGDQSDQALELLLRDHVRDKGIGELCGPVFYLFHMPHAEAFIRGVLDDHPDIDDRALACYALATYLQQQAKMLRRFRVKPESVNDYEPQARIDRIKQLLRERDPVVLENAAEKLFERTVREFGHVPYDGNASLADIAAGDLFAMRNLVVGRVAPDIEAADHTGKVFKLSDYRGKVTVLTFSGNWCGPCRAMYPQERELVERLKDRSFALVSVNTDKDKDILRKSIDSGEITWRSWWDGGTTGPITTRWGVRSFPTIYVLDRDGVIRFINLRGKELDEAVESLLNP